MFVLKLPQVKLQKLIILQVVLFLFSGISAQNVKKEIQNYMSSIRTGSTSKAIAQFIYEPTNISKTISEAKSFITDTSLTVQSEAFRIVYYAGIKSTDTKVKQESVSILLSGMETKNGGICSICSNGLTQFTTSDYTEDSKNKIKSLITLRVPYLDIMIKLCGFLDMKDMIKTLDPLFFDNTIPQKARLAIYFAQARMGDQKAIDFILGKSKSMPVEDRFIYDVVPDLIYTRQREVFDYLITILNSDEKTCRSANPNKPVSIICGYRLSEKLAPVIQDFPYKLSVTGELDCKDYEKAIKEIRIWFEKNKSTYGIRKETF